MRTNIVWNRWKSTLKARSRLDCRIPGLLIQSNDFFVLRREEGFVIKRPGILYCTVLYCTVLYCTVLYCTVLYCTVLYCTVLYCTVLYCTVLYCTVLYYTVLVSPAKRADKSEKVQCYRKEISARSLDLRFRRHFDSPNTLSRAISYLAPRQTF